jgi:hypothetical protein
MPCTMAIDELVQLLRGLKAVRKAADAALLLEPADAAARIRILNVVDHAVAE